jgi:hypothetical protein
MSPNGSVLCVTAKLPGHVRVGVKTGKAQCEYMFSALPLRADIAQQSRHVRFVPIAVVSIAIEAT